MVSLREIILWWWGNGIVSVQQGGEVGFGVSVEVMPITFRGIMRFNVECWIIEALQLQKVILLRISIFEYERTSILNDKIRYY